MNFDLISTLVVMLDPSLGVEKLWCRKAQSSLGVLLTSMGRNKVEEENRELRGHKDTDKITVINEFCIKDSSSWSIVFKGSSI